MFTLSSSDDFDSDAVLLDDVDDVPVATQPSRSASGRVTQAYVEKEAFLQELLDYQSLCRKAAEEGKPDPKIPDTIGKRILDIAEGVGSRYNFANYTYRDEMVGDAIESCVKAVKKFNPDHAKRNPFGYFTKCVWWTFLSRMDYEKKAHQGKLKMMMDPNILMFDTMDGDSSDYGIDKTELLDFYYQGRD